MCGEGPGSRGKSARESRAAVKKKKRKVVKRRGLGATKAEHKSRALRILASFRNAWCGVQRAAQLA